MLSLGKETSIHADGKSWIIGRLTVGVIKSFRDWVAEQIGDPFEIVERFIDKLPPAEATRLLQESREIRDQLASFSLQCPLAKRFLATEAGMARLVMSLLHAHHPHVTESEAFGVMLALGEEATAKVIAASAGEVPAKNGQDSAVATATALPN